MKHSPDARSRRRRIWLLLGTLTIAGVVLALAWKDNKVPSSRDVADATTESQHEQAVPTAPYFAMKGFRVVTCPWRLPDVAVEQLHQMLRYREGTTFATKERFAGMMQTVWSGAKTFMDQYYGRIPSENPRGGDQAATFKTLFEAIGKLDAPDR